MYTFLWYCWPDNLVLEKYSVHQQYITLSSCYYLAIPFEVQNILKMSRRMPTGYFNENSAATTCAKHSAGTESPLQTPPNLLLPSHSPA